MSALDGSIVNTVLPVIQQDLRASIALIEWVPTIYFLIVSALLLSLGRAGDLYGQKRLWVGGLAIFGIGSALCALAPTAASLIAVRALQGLGAAVLFAGGPAIITRNVPAHQRGRALGAIATFTYLGLTVGPVLGGWLADVLGWRSVFYVNVPLAALGAMLAVRAIPPDWRLNRAEPFDRLGAVTFAAGLLALLIALNQGHAWGWRDPRTLLLIVMAGVLATTFVGLERRRTNPMVDLSLFRSRTFSAATLAALCNYACAYCLLFVLPFLLIRARGLPPRRAGLILAAQPLLMAVVAPVAGAWSDRIGSRPLATAGMLIFATGLTAVALLTPHGTVVEIAAALGLIGIGVGLFTSPNNSALMGAAPRAQQGIAAAMLAAARNVGMVIGIAVAGAVFTTMGSSAPAVAQASVVVGAVRVSAFLAAAVAVVGAACATLID